MAFGRCAITSVFAVCTETKPSSHFLLSLARSLVMVVVIHREYVEHRIAHTGYKHMHFIVVTHTERHRASSNNLHKTSIEKVKCKELEVRERENTI